MKRYKAAQLKRDRVLELTSDGMTVKDACAAVGFSDKSYQYHRRKFPVWAAQVTESLHRHRRRPRADDDMTMADWSARYCHRRHLAHQLALAEALDKTDRGEITMFNVWPGSGKSSVILDWVTRTVAEDPDHRIMYVSEASSLVDDFVTQISKRFRNETEVLVGNETADFSALVARYGPFYEAGQERNHKKPWGGGRLTVMGSKNDAKDPTIAAYAILSRAYGSRADTLIVDDVQSTVSLSQTARYLKILRQTYFNRGTPSKPLRIFICGTRIGQGDIYERLLDEGVVDHLVSWPATCWDDRRERFVPRVPAAWLMEDHNIDVSKLTPEELMDLAIVKMDRQKRTVGPDAWAAQYEQEPKTSVSSTFGDAVENCLDVTRTFGLAAAA